MRRATLHRATIRRAGSGAAAVGVTSISFNGGAVQTGVINLRSPMFADLAGPNTRVDNGNVKILTPAASVTGIDVDLNQSFTLDVEQNSALANPTVSILATPRNGELINFLFQQPGDDFFRVTFGTKYIFAIVGAVVGVTQAQYDALEDDAQANGRSWGIGFRYTGSGADKWIAVGLTGPFFL